MYTRMRFLSLGLVYKYGVYHADSQIIDLKTMDLQSQILVMETARLIDDSASDL